MREGARAGANDRRANHWIVSPSFDLGWFVLPGLLAALVGGLIVLSDPTSIGRTVGTAETGTTSSLAGTVAIWIVGVLLVDVAHVYASIYRTYLDPEAWQHHGARMRWVPLAVLVAGICLHLASPAWFWRVLAYVAIFHFIKQHEGFVALYARGGGESQLDTRLARATVWAGTLCPVLWWHGHLPRRFAWFVEGDLVAGLPAQLAGIALAAQLPLLLAFAWRRIALLRAGRPNWMVPALVLTPMLCWNLGIVWTDDDRIFTVTNVFLHGIPYLALVWVAGGRERLEGWLGHEGAGARTSRRAPVLLLVVAYYGLLVGFAFGEEALWDRLLWHERGWLFGEGGWPQPDRLTASIIAGVLTVPQATHYVLDRFIWRSGPQNPRLPAQLGFRKRAPEGGPQRSDAGA